MEGLKILGCTGEGGAPGGCTERGAAGIHDTHDIFQHCKGPGNAGSPASII